MTRPPWEVADIIRRAGNKFLERYCDSLTWPQLKVLRAIARCRTAALGGHRDQCVRCGHQAISYNSCRNRHCPKCQTNATGEVVVRPATGTAAGWLLSPGLQRAARAGSADLAEQEVSSGSCSTPAPPRCWKLRPIRHHLGAEIGFLSILHTWGQTLQRHPHIHCVVPGGGLSPDHSRWIRSRTPLLFAGESTQPRFSREVRGRIAAGFSEEATCLLWPVSAVGE